MDEKEKSKKLMNPYNLVLYFPTQTPNEKSVQFNPSKSAHEPMQCGAVGSEPTERPSEPRISISERNRFYGRDEHMASRTTTGTVPSHRAQCAISVRGLDPNSAIRYLGK